MPATSVNFGPFGGVGMAAAYAGLHAGHRPATPAACSLPCSLPVSRIRAAGPCMLPLQSPSSARSTRQRAPGRSWTSWRKCLSWLLPTLTSVPVVVPEHCSRQFCSHSSRKCSGSNITARRGADCARCGQRASRGGHRARMGTLLRTTLIPWQLWSCPHHWAKQPAASCQAPWSLTTRP